MKDEKFVERLWILDKKELKKKATTMFQKRRRMEEANKDGIVRCISCGRFKHYKNCDGGHFIQRGSFSVLFDKDNVWPQCVRCNRPKYGLGGNYANYRENLVKKIGKEAIEALEAQKNDMSHFGNEREIMINVIMDSRVIIKRLEKVLPD